MAAGRPGGYLHIDWNGDLTPCAFIPYAAGSIHDVYARGGNLNDVLDAPFFKYIRRWQDAYGYVAHAQSPDNWLAPCIVRDHFGCLCASARLAHARPVDAAAAAALDDARFAAGMADYGKSYRGLVDPLWRSTYLKPRRREKTLLPAGD